jgi:hypothetical protein
MFRKLSLLALAFAMSFAAACASPAGLSRDDEGTGADSVALCAVVVGSQTRYEPCDEPQDFSGRR